MKQHLSIFLVSLVLHLGLYFLVSSLFKPTPVDRASQAIKVRYIQARGEKAKQNTKKQSSSSQAIRSPQDKAPAKALKKPKTGGAKSSERKSGSYRDLFPTKLEAAQQTLNAGNFETVGERELSASEEVKAMPKLDRLAQELAQRVWIPKFLIEDYPSGSGRVRIQKKRGSWAPDHPRGNRYYRSILFDAAIDALKEFEPPSDMSYIFLSLNVRTVSEELNQKIPASSLRVRGRSITLELNFVERNKVWEVLMPGGEGAVALNLLGVARLLIEPLMKEELNTEKFKIESSPAFSRP